MLCFLALLVLATLGVFSARHRLVAREALACVFRRVTLRSCTTGFDRRVKAAVVGRVMRTHPAAARLLQRHLEAVAWIFVVGLVASATSVAYGSYNFARYGSCYGPVRRGFCPFDPSGRHSRYSGIVTGYRGHAIVPDDGGGPARGPTDAVVTVIEFGCYTCRYTRESGGVVDPVLARHRADVRFVYRHFPLDVADPGRATCEPGPSIPHAGATHAAIAAVCAGRQGRFWDYHRRLLASPEIAGSCDALLRLATDVGMDGAAFAACLGDGEAAQVVQRDLDDGVRAGIYGTPTFFVNGERLVAPTDAELERAVEHALEGAHR